MTLPRRRVIAVAALVAPALARSGALAQPAWPSGPVRIVAPFPPGGSVDSFARLLAPSLSSALGVPFVVENRSGAGGALGSAAVARAAPDGQTWLLCFDTHATMRALTPDLSFDPRRDFTPVMLLATAPMLLTTPNDRPFRSMADLIATASARPDAITYGTIGIGSLAHLTMELLQARARIGLIHVPYRGGSPLSAAAAAGEVDLAIASPIGLGGQVGVRLRPLAQSGAERSTVLSQLPTFAEAGVPGVVASAFWGMLGPAGLPDPIVARFHAALVQSLAEPELRRRLVEGQGVDLVGSTPAEFGAFLDREIARWTAVIREKNIRAT